MNAPRDTSYEDELIQSLTDPTEAAAYLDAVMELEDAPALLLALRQVVKGWPIPHRHEPRKSTHENARDTQGHHAGKPCC